MLFRSRPSARFRLLATLLALSASAAVAANNHPGMSDRAAEHAQAGGAEMVDVIVQYKEMPGQAQANRAAGLGGETHRAYGQMPMRAMRMPAQALNALANGNDVRFVSIDRRNVKGLTEAARLTANEPVGSNTNASFVGFGVGVAVIDSGVMSHSDQNNFTMQYGFLGGASNAPTFNNGVITQYNDQPLSDDFGHGTHVAGIIAGDGRESDGALNRGLAEKAPVVSLQVLDANGQGVVSDLIAALDWLLQYGAALDIRVVNMSLGKGVESAAADDPLVQATEAVWDAGFVVVASAGNYGRDGHFTVTSPGNSQKVITVGSLTDNETGTDLSDDYVSTYSSRGPTLYDHFLKPDLLAPGNRVVATIPEVAQLRTDLADRVEICSINQNCTDDYLEISGTSMAAAMVSGTAVRMLDKDPSLTPDTIKARLMRSARKIDGDVTVVGAGRAQLAGSILGLAERYHPQLRVDIFY